MGLEKFGQKLSEFASTATKKAGEQVQIAKLGLDKAGLEKEIDAIYIAMGRFCYTALKGGTALPLDLKEYCGDIDNLLEQITEINTEIIQHKQERDGPVVTELESVQSAGFEELEVSPEAKPTDVSQNSQE